MVRRRLLGSTLTAGAVFAATVAAGVTAPLAGAAPAAAADPAAGCVDNGATVTCTFAFTGDEQTWTVPAGVTSATFDLWGAQGGAASDDDDAPGRGAHVTSSLSVTPGATLQLVVGGQGGISRRDSGDPDAYDGAGYNGGGAAEDDAGGGGGATDVRTSGGQVADRLLVAAGGGGSGSPGDGRETAGEGGVGGSSGSPGASGSASPSVLVLGGDGGGKGLADQGGLGGHSGAYLPGVPDPWAGSPGDLGAGGHGGIFTETLNGGGGGGGWYGGGGGGAGSFAPSLDEVSGAGGGGGGSSYAPGGTIVEGVREGNGLAQVTYTEPTPQDTTRPSVTINQAPGQPDPTTTPSVEFAVVFSEPVTGFSAADVVVSGTAPGALVAPIAGSGSSYTVRVAGMNGPGTIVVSVPAEAAQDAAGNWSTASTSTDDTVTYAPDVTHPTVTINQAAGQEDPTSVATVRFAVVFSEPVADFTATDVSMEGYAPNAVVTSVSGSGTTYTVTVTGMTGPGTVTAVVPAGAAHDAAGNSNALSTSSDNTVTFDPTPPKQPQQVRFTTAAPSGARVGGTYAAGAAGGGSGNPVVISVAPASRQVCSIAGGTVRFDHAGSCVLHADQAGSAAYEAGHAEQEILVGKGHQQIDFTSTPPDPGRVGETYTPRATGGPSGSPVTFAVAASSTPGACTITDGVVTFAGPGICSVQASQAGNADYEPAVSVVQEVSVVAPPVVSETVLTVGPDTLTARVTGDGDESPTGTVSFAVDGEQAGVAELVPEGAGAAVAVLEVVVPSGGERVVRASYGGDEVHAASSDEVTRTDPTVTAELGSRKAQRNGWWRAPVVVTFTCEAGSGQVTCPDPARLSESAADQQVVRTVTADDGGSATVTVADIDIDRVRPTVVVGGVRNGATYFQTQEITCEATDDVSGMDRCKVRTTRDRLRNGNVRVRYSAHAVDNAGNTATARGRYAINR
ncbi:MAG TPA: glycine-rich protein [Nocardioides sp.]|nr:glycine-rich protein [Nocardioides sp.]